MNQRIGNVSLSSSWTIKKKLVMAVKKKTRQSEADVTVWFTWTIDGPQKAEHKSGLKKTHKKESY